MRVKITTNPNKNLVEEIRAKIKENNGHCCCAIQFTDDNLCMCKEFREKIEKLESGTCDCGLYTIEVCDD